MPVEFTDEKFGTRRAEPSVDVVDSNTTKVDVNRSHQNLEEQYSNIKWQNGIFLPFDRSFDNAVIFSVIIVIFLVIYKIAYSADTTMRVPEYYIIPLCDLVYLVDTLLRVAHNLMTKVRQTREYLPTNWLSLIVDAISLIPFNLIYHVWVTDTESASQETYSVLTSNRLLRIYRLPLHFLHLRSAIGAKNLWQLTTGYVEIYLVFGHILAAILHTMACWGCEELNWTHSFPSDVLDSSKRLNQFLAAITVTLSLNWNNARANISATVFKEWCFFSTAMVTGFLMKSMFYAFLVSTFRRNMWRQLSFMLEINSEEEFVKSWGTPHSLRNQLNLYHSTLLKNRAAIKKRPKFFHTLPGPLQRSVQLDLHWEMLKHSQLFRNQDTAFKRALSCTMRIQYFLPGEYAFRVNRSVYFHTNTVYSLYDCLAIIICQRLSEATSKTHGHPWEVCSVHRYTAKMIYITSGVLQVLTEDDAETPILSLSSGTTLGEGTLLMPSKCRADIRSATHTEVHILDATSLYRLLHLYPKVAAHLHEKRTVRATIAQNLKRLKQSYIGHDENVTYHNGISWLKTQWHAIESTVKYDDLAPSDSIPIDGTRTSRYLELLALSDKVELMSNAVCLQMGCPCILEPESNFLNYCERVIIFTSVIIILLYPYYIAFTDTFPNGLLLLDTIFIIIRSVDIYIQASTAVRLPNQLMVVDIGHLLRLRMQTMSFIIDVIVTIPIELFFMTFGSGPGSNFSYYSFSAYRVNRLLTVYRLYKFILEYEKNFGDNVEPVKMCRSIFTYIVAVYWLAAITHFFSCEEKGCDSWIGYYTTVAEEVFGGMELFRNTLIITVYHIFNTVTSLGVSRLVPRNNWEILLLDVVVIFSLILYIHFCAELGATHIIHFESKNAAMEHVHMVTQFLILHGNSTDIISRVRDHLCAQWEYNKFSRTVEGKLLTVACQDLYDKIIIHSIMRTLRATPIFQDGDEAFLEILAKKAKVFLLTKDTMIAQAGLKTTAIYVIRNGYCRVVSALPSDVDRDRTEIVGPGSMILVIEFLHNTNNLADIHAITTCEIIAIRHSDFWNTLNMFPDYKAEFENAIDHDYFTGKTIVDLSAKREQEKADAYQNLAALDEKTVLLQYLTPFQRLGIFSIIRYLLLRRGINPHGKNFKNWEKFREIVCFLSAVFYPKFFTSLVAYPEVRIIGYMFDIVGFIDIYVRLHVSYYNENGILVTHPLWTAKHYLASSFSADIIMSTPLELFGLQNALGSQKAHSTEAWFYLITRPVLLFRIFGRFAMMKNDIKHHRKSLARFRFLVSTGVMLNALSCGNMLSICEFHHKGGVYQNMECNVHSWFSSSHFNSYKDPLAIYWISVYFYATFMFRCGNGTILVVRALEMLIVMLVCITVIPTWWMLVAQITGDKVGGDLSLTNYRQEMQALLRYLRKEDVSPELISLTIDEVEHRWKCSKESDWKKLFQTLPSQLHEEVATELHGPALARVILFKGQGSSAIRLLASQVNDTCFRRGTPIIRRNEVQGNVYIIQDGVVDVLAADDTLIRTLGPGGVFGSFRRKHHVRHKMQIMARGHVLLFLISSEKFYSIIDHFPVIRTRLYNATVTDAEFIDSHTITSNVENNDKESVSQSKTYLQLIFISEKSTWYKWFQWILCLPISLLSVYLVTSQIALQALNVHVNSLIYTCDLLFLVKIYFGFHTYFVEESSGVLITDHRLIAKKYLGSRHLFWLDLLCCIPFEILGYTTSKPRVRARLFTVLKLNRLLRLFHILHFQAQGHRKLYLSPVKSGVYLCTMNLLYVHMGVCLWIFMACRESGCKHRIPPDRETHFVTGRFEAMQLAYQYNFDLLTAVGSQDIQPTNLTEVLISIFLIFLYQVMALNLLTTFAGFIHFAQYTFTNFEIQAERLYSFMKSRSLSPILLQRIWEYCLQQWVRQKGAWMPSMISSMPNFLQHQIMFDIYGYLLLESDIFHGLHEDFLFQLTARMKRCVYFPKNYIVQAGDVNHTMYFIHSGEVKILSEPQPTVHGLGSILGVKQGVTDALPHFNDVVALTVTDVMSLHKNAWKDLLAEFPSVRIILSKRISRVSENY